MTSQGTSIAALLKKTEHYDKDERYMATSDLCDALKKHAQALSAIKDADTSMSDEPSTSTSTNIDSSIQMIDMASEQKICNAVLRLVDDSSNDVQAIAVKTLGVLVTTVHEDQVVGIAQKLGALVLDESKSALRDVYAIGLRTLVKTVPINTGDIVSSKISAELMDGIRIRAKDIKDMSAASTKEERDKSKVAEEITLACLEILTDLLTRFGSLPVISRQHETLLEVILAQLASDSHLIRKRAGNTIGCLAIVVSDDLLYRLVEFLLSQIDRAEAVGKSGKRKSRRLNTSSDDNAHGNKPKDTRALIRTMCTVAGYVGHRLGQEQIDRLVPIFLRFVDPRDAVSGDDLYDDNSDTNDDMMEDNEVEDEATMSLANELRESCFTGFESFVLRRPTQIQPHLPQIIHSALAYMRHDPNYSYGDENQSDNEQTEEDSEDYDMEDEEEYEDEEDEFDDASDDDDDSWKVRRSAIRTLSAVAGSTTTDITKLWTEEYSWRRNEKWKITVAGALVNRFKERDENCRVDVIECFEKLLAATINNAPKKDIILAFKESMDITENDGSMIDLRKFAPSVVKGCEKQLSSKKAGLRTKTAAIALLSTLCNASGGIGRVSDIKAIFEHVKLVLKDATSRPGSGHSSNKMLKLDCLHFVHVIVSSDKQDPNDIKEGVLDVILEDLCSNMDENWYKITSETLRIFAKIPILLTKTNSTNEELKRKASSLCNYIEPKLSVHDADQEVKECSLFAAASLISILHSSLSKEQSDSLLKLILQRLKNETTRIPAIKTISRIALESKPVHGKSSLSLIAFDVLSELSSLSRQTSRTIKQNALQCIKILIRSNLDDLDPTVCGCLLRDISSNIVENDLHISHLSLQAALAILESKVPVMDEIKENLLPAALDLSKSALLQDKALDSLLTVLDKLVTAHAVPFQDLLNELNSRLPSAAENAPVSGSKHSIANLAKCISAISAAADENERNGVVSDILLALEGKTKVLDSFNAQLLLRVAGDLGRLIDLSKMPGVTERLQTIYMSSFDSPHEDVKNASAYGLGRSCVGAMSSFLPMILSALEQNDQRKQYLLLTALKEFLYCHQQGYGGDIGSSVDQILPHLNRHLADEEEGVRTMVAECLGCLTCLQPIVILPQLQLLVEKNMGNKTPVVCCTVATSMKYAIASKCDTKATLPFIPTFLKLLHEDDAAVKNAALIMVYSAIHHNPDLVIEYMKELILPSLYELSQLKLKRQVDLGPFKQTIDDALPIRKASLSIFASCIEKCPDVLDIPSFMPILAKALDDVEDVQLQAHQIAITMCTRYPREIIAAAASFVKPLENTMNKKTSNKSGTELERALEWVKSAVRVMVTMSHVNESMSCPEFADLVVRMKKSSTIMPIIKVIEANRDQ